MKKLKANLFTIHTSANEIAKAHAQWAIDRQNVQSKSKATIIKGYKKLYENLCSDPICTIKQSIVSLSCSVTKKEIGFYMQSEHTSFTRMSLVYIKPKYRGKGLFKVLLKHFEDNAKGLCLIDREYDQDYKHKEVIFKHYGYEHTSTIGNGQIPVLTKIKGFDSSFYDMEDSVQDRLHKLELFQKKSKDHQQLFKDCFDRADFLSIYNKVDKSFKELHRPSLALEYLLYERENDYSKGNEMWRSYVEQYIDELERDSRDSLVA